MDKLIRRVIVAAGLLLTAAIGAHAAEESRTVVALGSAAVQGANVAAARDAAIGAGLLEAVARVAMEVLTPEVFAENFRRLNETLLDRPDTFVRDFRVLSEAAAGKQHRVLVQATVPVKPIHDLASRLGPAALRPAAATDPLVLTVEGTGSLAHSIQFRKALAGTPGVEGIQVKEVKPNETTLRVTYRGTPEDMVRALTAQPFDTFSVNVIDTDPAALKVALVSK
jgi:hypothetical protein